ncbi:type IX secretion system outer membrane channel protein PorV [Mucilaginibacter sp. KACC 22063]|uniref:type IX secretion system outer membrane channel protein PorV n=1 Tax=Mucilaginibacter sp. KACC 22063 TaxID=3025666 RepID=UPI002366015F|nr:type IX secretion system outer membrane channel protein PorV [Mucilaginibacter sp. KACC 22063]WDF53920.1 type IX secretion system outer membrane channel protein PorV [Mucilaginibacter sp. KACC 22063]
MKRTVLYLSLLFSATSLKAQVLNGGVNTNGSQSNAILTAVPFLNIAPDARSSGMGDAGVALEPTTYATFWNPSALAFLEDGKNISLSYSPWMRRITPDANLGYVNFSQKVGQRSAIGFSLRYFNLGEVSTYDYNENPLGSYHPNELSLDAAYARKFGPNFSLSLSLRYIRSSIVRSGASIDGANGKTGNAVAADVSLYYRKPIDQFGTTGTFSFGTNISNIGTKMSYYSVGQSYFLPTNLKIGAADMIKLDDMNQFTIAFDINKLLVPTPPLRDQNGNIIKGKNDDRSVVSGIFGSFTDAPGGFSEEIKEVAFSPGVEYMYNHIFALRTGYFYEAPSKGNRQYLTLGAGLNVKGFNFDFSYLVASQQNSPLANTLRFSLNYNFK